MNAIMSLRPDNDGSMRHLTLVLGNGARLSQQNLAIVEDANSALPGLGQAQAALVSGIALLADELSRIAARIERCQTLRREIAAGP